MSHLENNLFEEFNNTTKARQAVFQFNYRDNFLREIGHSMMDGIVYVVAQGTTINNDKYEKYQSKHNEFCLQYYKY